MSDPVIDPDLLAEVEAALKLPDITVLADATAPWWLAMAHAGCKTLGLQALHDEHCTEADDLDSIAASAEAMLTALHGWLREHDIPRLAFCFIYQGDWMWATIKGTEAGSFADDGDDEEDEDPCS